MFSAKQQVTELIQDYQTAVYKAVALLNAKSEQDCGFQQREESPGYRAGYLDAQQRVRYAFHGAGCLVNMFGVEVDFDYAKEGGCTGIDPWFLINFLQNNPAIQAKYPSLTNDTKVTQILQELVKDGTLAQYVHSADDWRYYWVADIGNPNLPEVVLRWSEKDEAE
ncbi:DUF6896 domain-containing protein [Hymenobacter metallilatus]|uniref:DUF6896 domain-containing protein n=1 Tax=Hymenobacter metallilatus TaxID=2493666 RepID=A0A3R9NZD2_9BACT|nr:hypothetical protein [Hymenobacter metallilatus]RSK24709.1 hypothetical protein EI290_18810 [Hymenobacter metallilatus]